MYSESEEDKYYARVLRQDTKDTIAKSKVSNTAVDPVGQVKRERLVDNKDVEYHLRLDELNDGGDQIVLMSLINTFVCSKILMYFEHGKESEKPHYHVFLSTSMSKKSMDNALNYAFPKHKGEGKGKGGGSHKSFVRAVNAKSLESYVGKDGNAIMTHGYTDEELKAIKKWVGKKDYKQNMVDVLLKVVPAKTKDKREVCRHILQWYKMNRKPADKYRIKAYCNTIWMINNGIKDDSDTMEELITEMLN